MTKAAAAQLATSLEAGPRRSLQWGGGLLVLGLGLVGVGAPNEGAVFALSGLLLTIYGIHTFGRLGPDDQDPGAEQARREAQRAADVDRLWTGLLGLVAGLVLVVGAYTSGASITPETHLTTFVVIALGAARAIQGVLALRSPPAPAPARTKVRSKVAPRRRLDKSPPP